MPQSSPVCGVTIYLDPIASPDDRVTIEAYSESVLDTVEDYYSDGLEVPVLMFVGPRRTEVIPTNMVQRIRVHHDPNNP